MAAENFPRVNAPLVTMLLFNGYCPSYINILFSGLNDKCIQVSRFSEKISVATVDVKGRMLRISMERMALGSIRLG